jgi:hypothetical protein
MTVRFLPSSYSPEDVTFLMAPIELTPLPIEVRERRISEGHHYSEMIGSEDSPGLDRMRIFRAAVKCHLRRFAELLVEMARALLERSDGREISLVSIARAGTPVGVALARWIREIRPDMSVSHYSLSVIRDRGLDHVALQWILARHPARTLRFVDGWTGKGTIAGELRRSLLAGVESHEDLESGLWVPVDAGGFAGFAVTTADLILPHALLGGTVSGLVSRSVLAAGAKEGDRQHGAVPLPHLRKYDLTQWFVRTVLEEMRTVDPAQAERAADWSPAIALKRRRLTEQALHVIAREWEVRDPNRIKVGLGETVRVLLRRAPRCVLLDSACPASDRSLIEALARMRGLEPTRTDGGPFSATAIIAESASPAWGLDVPRIRSAPHGGRQA